MVIYTSFSSEVFVKMIFFIVFVATELDLKAFTASLSKGTIDCLFQLFLEIKQS